MDGQAGARERSFLRTTYTTFLVVFVLIFIYAVLPLTGSDGTFGAALGVIVIASVVPLVARRVRAVLHADRPLAEAAAAIVLSSALMVLGPASVYYALSQSDPDQFRSLETKIDGVYFTVTVMSTVGFGDIVPLGQTARLLTTIHIVLTVAFVGGAIRLIAWATKHRITDRASILVGDDRDRREPS